ncbi:unnamed protein product [Gadus morhua 'NCC']
MAQEDSRDTAESVSLYVLYGSRRVAASCLHSAVFPPRPHGLLSGDTKPARAAASRSALVLAPGGGGGTKAPTASASCATSPRRRLALHGSR